MKGKLKNKPRFIGGLLMILAAAILMFTNHGQHSTVPYTGLAVIGIVLIATARRKK